MRKICNIPVCIIDVNEYVQYIQGQVHVTPTLWVSLVRGCLHVGKLIVILAPFIRQQFWERHS